MKLKKPNSLAALAIFIILALRLHGQPCGNCSTVISGTNAASYTVNTGQTLCIDSTGIFTGSLTLSGGTLCNKGNFKPALFMFDSGTFTNNSIAAITGTLNLSNGKTVLCGKRSFLQLSGDATVSGGNFSNKGIVNIKNNVTSNSGTFSNTGILNCRTFSGAVGSYTNTGIINKD
jgi:phage baseplate assembly protein gpV